MYCFPVTLNELHLANNVNNFKYSQARRKRVESDDKYRSKCGKCFTVIIHLKRLLFWPPKFGVHEREHERNRIETNGLS